MRVHVVRTGWAFLPDNSLPVWEAPHSSLWGWHWTQGQHLNVEESRRVLWTQKSMWRGCQHPSLGHSAMKFFEVIHTEVTQKVGSRGDQRPTPR